MIILSLLPLSFIFPTLVTAIDLRFPFGTDQKVRGVNIGMDSHCFSREFPDIWVPWIGGWLVLEVSSRTSCNRCSVSVYKRTDYPSRLSLSHGSRLRSSIAQGIHPLLTIGTPGSQRMTSLPSPPLGESLVMSCCLFMASSGPLCSTWCPRDRLNHVRIPVSAPPKYDTGAL